jgi:uncharacterized membrane protein YidH (DUF202 family)
MSEPADRDVTRRTRLAAERTWLAWWRSGIAPVGGVVPEQVDRALDRGDYEQLGETGVVGLTIAAMMLALGTLVVIIAQA